VTDVLVVGAGLGGLAAAIELAVAGRRVTVLEAADRPGGKASTTDVEGLECDTGPSLLTLPEVFDAVLQAAGTRLADEVDLQRLDPAFRYLWPDGAELIVHGSTDATLAEVQERFGATARRELTEFLVYAKRIWDASDAAFVRGPAPSFASFMHPQAFGLLRKIDPLRSMAAAIDARVREPHLRDLLRRYATYNGSDPRRSPATLNCIAHVELGLGGWGVRGGMHALALALARVAERRGVRFRYGTPVQRILRERGRVRGVELAGGARLGAEAVVANADAAHVADALLPDAPVPRPPEPLSMSGWNAILRAAPQDRVAHTVLFPAKYDEEFADVFDRDRPPESPTVYQCAQRVAAGRGTWEDGTEPVFLMANAPPEPRRGRRDPAIWTRLERVVLARLRDAGLAAADDRIAWRRSPAGLAARFPGSRGALYGGASTSRTAAFRRPPNRVRAVPGLYLASGSAHPGGGMPLAVLSGRAAAAAVRADHGDR
jgi:1-hydroxycarotenoid 3,4-desaturase